MKIEGDGCNALNQCNEINKCSGNDNDDQKHRKIHMDEHYSFKIYYLHNLISEYLHYISMPSNV